MKKHLLIIPMVLLTVGFAAVCVHHTAATVLAHENSHLKAQVTILAPFAAENRSLSNHLAAAQSARASATEQLRELKQLRAELDGQNREIASVSSEIAAIPSNSFPELPSTYCFDNVPKSSWQFSGYDTPEAALQSMLWATLKGDVDAIRASITRGEKERRLLDVWKNKSDSEIATEGTTRLGKATGFQILQKRMQSLDERVTFCIYLDGINYPEQPLQFEVVKFGNEWKCDSLDSHRYW